MFMYMEEIYDVFLKVDVFIVIGILGNVYFVVGFVQIVKESGVYIIEVNLELGVINVLFDELLIGFVFYIVL